MKDTTTNQPGIYRISIGPRTFYWGQSSNLRKRKVSHLAYLRRGDHNNRQLQASWDKHGEDGFTFEVSLLCPVEDLNMQEQFALDIYHGEPGCANIAKCAEAPGRGLKRSEEYCRRNGDRHRGKTISKEQREKLSQAGLGRVHSEETRRKMSAWQVGKKHGRSTREAISAGHNKNHPNVRVLFDGGVEEVWSSQAGLARALGHKNSSYVNHWLTGHSAVPDKYNIVSISRTNQTPTHPIK